MTTRAAPLSPAHVEALNAMPIEFYRHRPIIEAWKEYLDHLSAQGFTPEAWGQKRIELLITLLLKMANFLRYRFTRVEISREVYSPTAHGMIEQEQQIIRQGLARLFKGEFPIPMEVKSFPAEAGALEEQRDLRGLLLKWLGGQQSVRVDLQEPRSTGQASHPK